MEALHRGLCIDDRDPQGLGRIRVQVPKVLGASASGWAFPAWSMGDTDIWPEDRKPKPGQGVWVAFEAPDRMVWLAVFGPQEFSAQRFDSIIDDTTGLPIAYRTSMKWILPEMAEGSPVLIPGFLDSLSGDPHPSPSRIFYEKSPDGEAWEAMDSTDTDISGDFAIEYTRPAGEVGWWYRARFKGQFPFWPASTPEEQAPAPTDPSSLEWDISPEFAWKFSSFATGTLLDGSSDPVVGREIRVYRRIDGGEWRPWGSPDTTDTLGNWTIRLDWEDSVRSPWEARAYFFGDSSHGYATTDAVSVEGPDVDVDIAWKFPANPTVYSKYTISGTATTERYGVPEEVSRLFFEILPQGSEKWEVVSSVPVARSGAWSFDYTFTNADASYRMRFEGVGPYNLSFSGTEYRRLVLGTSAPTPSLGAMTYNGVYSWTGTVQDQQGQPVRSGSVRLEYRYESETDDDYRPAAPDAGVTLDGVFTVRTPPLDFLGAARYRLQFLGDTDGFYTPSTSQYLPTRVGLAKIDGLAKISVTHSSAAISWTAVPGAVQYEVVVNGLDEATVPDLSYSDTGLSTDKTYTYQVRAVATDVDGAVVRAVLSPTVTASTGRPEQRKSGSFVKDMRPTATGHWRAKDGWNVYAPYQVKQGYFSDSTTNHYGLITYNGKNFRDWVTTQYGADVLANLSYDKTQIRLYRVSGAGNDLGAWPPTFWVSSATANTGNPSQTFAGNRLALTNIDDGTGAWVEVRDPWWGKHVMMNEKVAPGAKAVVSIGMYNNGTAYYTRYEAMSYAADSCNMRLNCSWNFVTVPYVAPKWL